MSELTHGQHRSRIRLTVTARLTLTLCGACFVALFLALFVQERLLVHDLDQAAARRLERARDAAGQLVHDHLRALEDRAAFLARASGLPGAMPHARAPAPSGERDRSTARTPAPTADQIASQIASQTAAREAAALVAFYTGDGRRLASVGDPELERTAAGIREAGLLALPSGLYAAAAVPVGPVGPGGPRPGRMVVMEAVDAERLDR